jgi:hypothetical protein
MGVKNNSRRRKLAKLAKKEATRRAIEQQFSPDAQAARKSNKPGLKRGALEPTRPEVVRREVFRSNREADAYARASSVKWKQALA